MQIEALSSNYNINEFDCGDADLNDFLRNSAQAYQERHIAKTFLLIDNEKIVAYFCLFNDKISRIEASNSAWRKVKRLFPHDKHFNSYPAVKIGRFAVSAEYRGKGVGTKLMKAIKHILDSEDSYSTFRFITVDAYKTAVPFYEKNGFSMLVSDDDDKHTRLMCFDMMTI